MATRTRLFSALAGLLALAIAGSLMLASPTYAAKPPSGPTLKNCTYTQGYWKNHLKSWPVTSLTLGNVTYTQARLSAIFATEPNGDATYILAHQLIAAMLNVANGASNTAVADTIVKANALLARAPLGSNPSGSIRSEAIAYASTLDQFNNGLIGPGHCDQVGTTAPTNTPAPTSAPTNTPAPTSAPTNTPAPTSSSIGGTIWYDGNYDRVFDGDEYGVPQVTVELYRDNGDGVLGPEDTLVGSTTTDDSGNYDFTGLPSGTYVVNVLSDCPTATGPIEATGAQIDVDIDTNSGCMS